MKHQTSVQDLLSTANIAARSPESAHFQKIQDTIEKRSGRWLKKLVGQSQAAFDLNAWIQA